MVNRIIIGIIGFIFVVLAIITGIDEATGPQRLPDVQQVHTPQNPPVVAPQPSQTPLDDGWDPFGDTTKPPLIPPVGPAWVTGVGTGGIGVIA